MQDKTVELLNQLIKGQKEIYNLLREYNAKLGEHSMFLEGHTEVLNALEENAMVTRAEIDKLNHIAAKLSGEMFVMKRDLEKVEVITENNISDIYELKKHK